MSTAFKATYSYCGTTVKVHAADCSQATDGVERCAWELRGESLDEAIADVTKTERIAERGWKVAVCKCARRAALSALPARTDPRQEK